MSEAGPVGILPVNGSSFVAASGNMIPSARAFDAQRTCHLPESNHHRGKESTFKCHLLRCDPFDLLTFDLLHHVLNSRSQQNPTKFLVVCEATRASVSLALISDKHARIAI